MIDDAITFFRDFLQKEYQVYQASLMERDEDAFSAKLAELQRYYKGLKAEVDRPYEPDEEWFEEADEQLSLRRPRTLFQVKHYRHPELGHLHRAYLSSMLDLGDSRYFSNHYAGYVDGDLRIIARYLVEDSPNEWMWNGGVQLDTLGELVEVRKLQEPDDPAHLKEYWAE